MRTISERASTVCPDTKRMAVGSQSPTTICIPFVSDASPSSAPPVSRALLDDHVGRDVGQPLLDWILHQQRLGVDRVAHEGGHVGDSDVN